MRRSMMRHALLLPTLACIALASGTFLEGYATPGRSWGTSTVRYYVNPQSKWLSESAAISAIQTASAIWHDQSSANVSLVYSGTTGGSSLTLNSKSEVFFRDDVSSHVAEAYWWWDGSNKLIDSDIVFHEGTYQFYAFSGCENGIYLENVAAHEFGHMLGLLHSAVPNVTMQPAMQSYCDLSQLTLEPDDIAGIEFLYPPSGGGATNTAPSVNIGGPGNNSSFAEGTSIAFSGSATDSQDGNLSASLRWSSNLSGQFGNGANVAATLPAGTHVVTASVTDAGGLTASRQVTVTVTAAPASQPPPTGPTLNAKGYKVKGLQKVDLSWSGLASASVDIFRNNQQIGTFANTGVATDALNKKGGGSYSYKACAAGTSDCSNTANVSF
jgi:hypothetical protein